MKPLIECNPVEDEGLLREFILGTSSACSKLSEYYKNEAERLRPIAIQYQNVTPSVFARAVMADQPVNLPTPWQSMDDSGNVLHIEKKAKEPTPHQYAEIRRVNLELIQSQTLEGALLKLSTEILEKTGAKPNNVYKIRVTAPGDKPVSGI